MRNEGIGSWPARRARKTPHRTALLHDGTALTYAALHARTARLAHALRSQGVRRGDRVAYLGPNHPSLLEALFASGLLGAVFVPLNTRLAPPELAHQIDDSGARLLLHGPTHAAAADHLLRHTGLTSLLDVSSTYEALIAAAPADRLDEPVTGGDPAMIMYTSGTTGRPKGAVLTHANLTWNAFNVLIDADYRPAERALVCAPLFHTAGLNMVTLPVLLKGGTCVLAGSFDAAETLRTVEREGITVLFGVPTMLGLMARTPEWDTADLSSLTRLVCGGAPVPGTLLDSYRRRGLDILQGYGMTEASPGVLFLDAEHAAAKIGSAGVPHFFTDVRLVATDGRDSAPGEAGEVLVNGPNVMSGYWGLPEASATALDGGWLHTGDLARADSDGFVTVVDRAKDMIISGGENIYPAEIEDLLLAHPAVAECAVIGVPHDKWGEVPLAVVVPVPDRDCDPAEVLASLSGLIAPYKIPKSLVLTDELPRTASGKLRKPLVRERHGHTRTKKEVKP